jgi:type II secretory pathway pseudopilin PulG
MAKNSEFHSMLGFTLLELVIVLLTISIIAIVAFPKVSYQAVTVNYVAQQILSDIRYAQILSSYQGQTYSWVKVSATTYQIKNAAGTAIMLSNGSTTQTLYSGVSISSLTNLPNNYILFGTDGTPYTSSSPLTSLASTAVVNLSDGSSSKTVQISPQTGYGAVV